MKAPVSGCVARPPTLLMPQKGRSSRGEEKALARERLSEGAEEESGLEADSSQRAKAPYEDPVW